MKVDICVCRIVAFMFIISIRGKEKHKIKFLALEKEVKVFLIALSLENLSILNSECKMNNPSGMVSIQTCTAELTAGDSLFIKMLNILMWSALAKRLYAVCHKYHLGVF